MNPYSAPGVPVRAESGRERGGRRLYERVLRLSLLVGPLYGFFVGCVLTIQNAYALERFDSLHLVPPIAALSLVRALGPWASLVATSLVFVVVIHRSASGDVALGQRWSQAHLLGFTVLLLYPLASALGMLGSAMTLWVVYSRSPSTFIASAGSMLLWSDLGVGLLFSAAYGAVAGGVLPLVAPLVGKSRRGLLIKLVVAYLALSLAHFAEGFVWQLIA